MDFFEKFPHRILIGDGDITTTLHHSKLPSHLGFPNLSITHPDAVLHAHSTAINAGALLIKSNSRDANALSLKNFGIERRVSEINWMAAQLAQNAARQAGVEMVGSVGPLPISTEEALRLDIDPLAIFTEQIGALIDGGARAILLDSFSDLPQLLLAVEAKHTLHHCPVIATLNCSASGQMPDGSLVADAFTQLQDADVDLLGINAPIPPSHLVDLFQNLSPKNPRTAVINLPFLSDPTADPHDPATLESFTQAILLLIQSKARWIDGGPGTTTHHLTILAKVIASLLPENPR
jgi:methionine synthase I (cobalamin-dependent)